MFWNGLINCGHGWYLSMLFGVYSVMFLYCKHDVLFIFYNFVEVHVVQALIETISKCQSQEIRQRHLMTAVWIGKPPFEPRSGRTPSCCLWVHWFGIWRWSHLPPRNKNQRSQALGRIWATPNKTLPDPDFDWNIVQNASAPHHQGVWAGQVQVPTKSPLIGMGRNTNACHAFVCHWCYSFLRTCL